MTQEQHKINDYLKLPLSEIKEKIEKNGEILNKIWEEDAGNSWTDYRIKCQPYWDDNKLLNAAVSMNTKLEDIEMEPMDEFHKKCRVPIKTFIEWCKYDAVTSYDGFGEYANENEVPNLHVSCWGIKNGLVRKDFTHVCWYNK